MNKIIFTNNILVKEKYDKMYDVCYHDVSFKQILIIVRDMIHKNYKLLTHPLSGSIKPNETPYKSLILEKSDSVDYDSILIISNSIMTAEKFEKIGIKKISEQMDADFKVIDLSLIEGCL